jgi:hypothetical protein
MGITPWIWATLLIKASCAPLQQTTDSTRLTIARASANNSTNSGQILQTGDSHVGRAACTAVSLICISLLSGMIGGDWLCILPWEIY